LANEKGYDFELSKIFKINNTPDGVSKCLHNNLNKLIESISSESLSMGMELEKTLKGYEDIANGSGDSVNKKLPILEIFNDIVIDSHKDLITNDIKTIADGKQNADGTVDCVEADAQYSSIISRYNVYRITKMDETQLKVKALKSKYLLNHITGVPANTININSDQSRGEADQNNVGGGSGSTPESKGVGSGSSLNTGNESATTEAFCDVSLR